MWKSVATPIAAARRRPRPNGLDDVAQRGSELHVARDVRRHRLRLAVPGVELAPLLAAGDRAGVAEVAARYELAIDFTTIPAPAERHGLTVAATA